MCYLCIEDNCNQSSEGNGNNEQGKCYNLSEYTVITSSKIPNIWQIIVCSTMINLLCSFLGSAKGVLWLVLCQNIEISCFLYRSEWWIYETPKRYVSRVMPPPFSLSTWDNIWFSTWRWYEKRIIGLAPQIPQRRRCQLLTKRIHHCVSIRNSCCDSRCRAVVILQ